MTIASHRRLWWLVSAALLLVLALAWSGPAWRPGPPAATHADQLPAAIEGLARHTPADLL